MTSVGTAELEAHLSEHLQAVRRGETIGALQDVPLLGPSRSEGDEDLADHRGRVLRLLEAKDHVDVSRAVLRRAADPFPTPLGTLDAQLATAARATGFATEGV